MQQQATPFTSTGPQGHRGRMRGRLLADGTALADYEILEMLLFLGIPRRDTKPLAKALINRFGSLRATLRAAADEPDGTDLPPRAAEALALVAESAALLARPDDRTRPTLDSWDALIRHLNPAARAGEPPGVSALLLNSRNQLVAEPSWPGAADLGALPRLVLRQALEHHASAVLLVRHGAERARVAPADRVLHQAVRDAAEALTVVVHDLVVLGQGRWVSLRQSGLG